MTGRFIQSYIKFPIVILNYLSKQLTGELIHKALEEPSANTLSRIKKQVSNFLGYQNWNNNCHDKVLAWLNENSNLIGNKKELTDKVEEFLRKEKIILPNRSQLMRAVFRRSVREYSTSRHFT